MADVEDTNWLVQEAEEYEDGPKVSKANTQYLIQGDKFIPCGPTVKKLTPGLYYPISTPSGSFLKFRKNITDDLIITPDSKTEEIVNEIKAFWNKKAVFKKFGLTHKRGILLHGIPGSGKTATVSLVMQNIIKMGGVALMSSDPYTTTSCLHFMREIDPPMPILLILEDIDSIIKSYGESQVLALLDGEDSIDNIVSIATTNYPEELAGRITNRPSRFDRVMEISTPNADARRAYLQSRKLGLSESDLEGWVEDTEGLGIAHLKELVVGVFALERPFDEILERLKGMSKAPTSDGEKPKVGFSGSEKQKPSFAKLASPRKAGFGN